MLQVFQWHRLRVAVLMETAAHLENESTLVSQRIHGKEGGGGGSRTLGGGRLRGTVSTGTA